MQDEKRVMQDEQLVDLETKITYQEDTIQVLNEALVQQQRQIDQLEAKVRMLFQKLGDMAEGPQEEGGQHEIPPHY